MEDIKTLIVFVQLGKNKSTTLNTFATNAGIRFTNSLVVLLTDYPKRWSDFPGEIIEIEDKSYFKTVSSQTDKVKHLRMGGYWLHTLNRLFVLDELKKHFPAQTRVIHFESDVLSFISSDLSEEIFSSFSGVAIPRYSKDSGIASILVASNLTVLSEVIKKLKAIAFESNSELNDMDLLGLALNRNIVLDLNKIEITTINPQSHSKIRIYFDGAAVGQYFFGVDTRKRKWETESGHINEHANFSLKEIRWGITESGKDIPFFLTFLHKEKEFLIANLHVHSKIPLSTNHKNFKFWEEFVHDMNNGKVRRFSIQNSFDWNQMRIVEAVRRIRLVIGFD